MTQKTTHTNLKQDGTFEIYASVFSAAKVIGTGSIWLQESKSLDEHVEADLDIYVEGIEIEEGYRGEGYGTAALEELSAAFGTYTISADNEDAARLYERLGFRLDERSKEYQETYHALDYGFGVYVI